MKKLLITALLVPGLLLAACGGSHSSETTLPLSETEPSATEIVPSPSETAASPTENLSATEASPATETSEEGSDFAPGARLSTIDPLAANGENSIVLLANPGGVLIAGVDPGVGQDVALGLFYLTGSGPGELAAQVNSGPGFETLTHTFQVAGAYRLAIRELNGVAGKYAMRIASSPGVALTIAPQHTVEGKLEGGGNVGFLHNGFAGREVTFKVEPNPGNFELDMSLSIVALSDMKTVLLTVDEAGAGSGEVATFVPTADDEYYLAVQGKDGSSGTFTLSMFEP
jgi:hypothetical protein